MTMIIVVVMAFVIAMVVVVIMIIVVVMLIVITMIVVIAMIIMVVVIIVVVVIIMVAMIIVVVVIMNMHFSIKVLSFSPNKCWAYSSLDDKRATIFESPLKNTAKHAINGVVLGIALEVGVKSTMTFDSDDRREVEFTSFKRFFPTTTMRTMGLDRRDRRQGTQKKSEKQKT
jgi:hypothetical protein